jgi:small-conductance mechanosensitive channel
MELYSHRYAFKPRSDDYLRGINLEIKVDNSKLHTMSKQELIDFMIRKGNDRKKDQQESAKILTQDSQNNLQSMIASLTKCLQPKQEKFETIEKLRKNFEIELSGLDMALQAQKGKVQKREDQRKQSDILIKKQQDQLRQIRKEITPKLVKELYSFLETFNHPKINVMTETLVSLLRNQEESKSGDVKVYLMKYEGLIYKMDTVEPAKIRDCVLTKHLDTVKTITKSFVDSSSEDYKVCSKFAPFLAWASQFLIYCRYA